MITEQNLLDAEAKILDILEQRDYAFDKKEKIRTALYLFGMLNNELEIR